MPRYYCDYCDIFLTHDAPGVRASHNTGRRHKESVRDWYMQWEEEARRLHQQRAMGMGAPPAGMPNVNVPPPSMAPFGRGMPPPPIPGRMPPGMGPGQFPMPPPGGRGMPFPPPMPFPMGMPLPGMPPPGVQPPPPAAIGTSEAPTTATTS